MIRWVILAVLVVVVAAAVPLAVNYLPADVAGPVPSSRSDEPVGPPPRLVVDEETTHDFGLMSERDEGLRTWTIRNEGEGPLRLRFIEKPCTCTGVRLGDGSALAEQQSLDIEPGEQAELSIAWETRDKIGDFSTYARFATNDYERYPTLSLTVKGLVTPAVVTDPARIDFPATQSDEEASASVLVYSPSRPEMALTSAPTTSRPRNLIASVRPATEEELANYNEVRSQHFGGHVHHPGEPEHDHDHGDTLPPVTSAYRVDVTLTPGLPLGRFSDVLTIKTDHPLKPTIELPIAGQIVGPISAMPERVYLPGVDRRQGRTINVTLNVRNHDETTFDVQIPETLREVVEASVEPASTGDAEGRFRQYRMQVRVPQGAKPGMHKGTLILRTNHPRAEEVKVPVEVLVRGN